MNVPTGAIYVGNAGTLMRLLPGWLSFQIGASFTLDGDASIRRRVQGQVGDVDTRPPERQRDLGDHPGPVWY